MDLQSYTAYQTTEKVAASGGGARFTRDGGSRLSVSRRPVLEMPLAPQPGAGERSGGSETLSLGAEFEPVSPLDVPAFLRRQQEGLGAPAAPKRRGREGGW